MSLKSTIGAVTMFTGIISDVGRVEAIDRNDQGARLRIACEYNPDSIDIGASIACAGVCLTVVARDGDRGACRFEVDASQETLALTTLGQIDPGAPLNLERALRAGDELGGHMVLGHIDGVAEITGRVPDGDSVRYSFTVPGHLSPMIAPKGSVALDGTSLTVNEVEGTVFGVNIIPHTSAVTTWANARVGDSVNLEVDVLSRYVARLMDARSGAA